MTRILALTNLFPNPLQPYRAAYNRDLVRALAACQPLALVAPILWTDELTALWRGGVTPLRDRFTIHDGLFVEHPRYFYPPKVLRHWYGHFYRWSVQKAFDRTVARFHPDVVFAPWAYPDGWAAIELGRRAGLPVVIKVHGSDVMLLSSFPGRRRRTVEALRAADGVVTVSRDLAERVINLGADPGRVRVVYGGVDSSRFHPGSRAEARARLGLPAGGPVLLFVGNLVSVKGLEVLLEACTMLRAVGVRFTCCLVGDGPLRASLQRQIKRQGLETQVQLMGPRPHDQLPDWFRAADLFALPSRSEGVPTVLLEAAACGTPFAASRVGGIPEVAPFGTSCLVPPGDAAALARALADGLEGTFTNYSPGSGFTRGPDDAAAEVAAFFTEIRGAYATVPPPARIRESAQV
ncbi:MAG: glycosyltransferase [Gemmataceae bacterium]|nr:glycosyltransferase [Gemmataceae bacterium]